MSRCAHGLRENRCPTCTTQALTAHLTTAVGWLASSLLPGTHRSAAVLSHYEDKRTPERREQDRLEREQRVDIAPGESPPPYNLEVADLLSEVLFEADTLSDQVADNVEAMLLAWAGPWAQNPETLRPPAASSAFADPTPFLRLLHELIPHITDPDLVEDVADRCYRLSERAAQVLGLIYDGQLLDAICPWCDGRTSAHPIGGRRTLRIRMSHEENPDESRPLIVCEGGFCDPGDQSGIRWKHLPAWDLLNEGDWLAACVKAKDNAAECRCGCGRLVLRSGKPGRPALYSSEDCRRAADAERQRLGRAS